MALSNERIKSFTRHFKTCSLYQGDTLHLVVASTKRELGRLVADHILKQGIHDAVIELDGVGIWVGDSEVVHLDREGADRYEWNAAGNKVKHSRRRYIRTRSGKVKSIHLRWVYRSIDEYDFLNV